ncbi:kinase-like domain-containing protein [Russula vinacea]|nr:kinase-like domain-containing protein [Russula vinacea]
MTSLTTPQFPAGQTIRTIGTLFRSEEWWRDQYHDIYNRGYELRPRYHPNWKPSYVLQWGTRRRDGKQVMLKKIYPDEGLHELIITQLFSSRQFSRDPCNHCVPLLDILEMPQNGQKLLVMPFLRPFNDPGFQTFGEFVAFFTQISLDQGLQFMHQRNIAHRDCTANNIMFDPSEMYPRGFHPTRMDRSRNFKGRANRYTRTQRPPRYYLIDLGLSRQYFSRRALDLPLRGGDKSAPEHRNATRCNPFYTDIYYIGNLVRQEFINEYHGFEFMQDLVDEMTHVNPAKRPLIEDVLAKFFRIRKFLSEFKLRSPLVSKEKPSLFTIFSRAKQALLTVQYIFSRKAAIPEP